MRELTFLEMEQVSGAIINPTTLFPELAAVTGWVGVAGLLYGSFKFGFSAGGWMYNNNILGIGTGASAAMDWFGANFGGGWAQQASPYAYGIYQPPQS